MKKLISNDTSAQNADLKTAQNDTNTSEQTSFSILIKDLLKTHVEERWQPVQEAIPEIALSEWNLPVKRDVIEAEYEKIQLNSQMSDASRTDATPSVFLEQSIRKQKNQNQEHAFNNSNAFFANVRNGAHLDPFTYGDFIKVKNLHEDQLKNKIRSRQKNMIEQLNNYPALAELVMSLPGMNKFFVKVQMKEDNIPQYYGTRFFYELYFGELDDLWLICQTWHALDGDLEKEANWLMNHWLYGDKFRNFLLIQADQENQVVLDKLNSCKGLTEVAMQWFWDVYATLVVKAETFPQHLINRPAREAEENYSPA